MSKQQRKKAAKDLPSTDGDDGRDAHGRFTPGNTAGRGNPYARQAAALRDALYNAITPDDMRRAVRKLADLAADGNVPAIRELFDRAVGKPIEADLLERLEALEAAVLEKEQ